MISRLCAAALLLLAGGVAVADDAPAFTLGPVSVQRPEGGGWQVVRRDERTVAFQRIDEVANRQSTAYVALMAFKAASGDLPGIEAELRQTIALTLPKLLDVQGVTYKGSQSREYSCVTAQAEASQTVPLPSGEQITLPMTLVIKACRLAGPGAVGYMAGWSHSALQRHAQAVDDAENFFKGVTLVPPAATTKVAPMPSRYSGTGKGVLRANSCPRVDYPPASLAAGRAGTGRIRVDLSAQAKVLSSEVIASSGAPELDEAARAVLPRCTYLPTFKDSVPVPDSLVIEYVWTLAPSPSVSFDSK